MAEEVFNPNRPQRDKRIETAEEIFNPKWLQRGKRIETAEEVFNPKWLQKAKWIETLVTVWEKYALPGAGAWASLNDGSLPNAAASSHPETDSQLFVHFVFHISAIFILSPICRSPFGREFLAGAGACVCLTDGSPPFIFYLSGLAF